MPYLTYNLAHKYEENLLFGNAGEVCLCDSQGSNSGSLKMSHTSYMMCTYHIVVIMVSISLSLQEFYSKLIWSDNICCSKLRMTFFSEQERRVTIIDL